MSKKHIYFKRYYKLFAYTRQNLNKDEILDKMLNDSELDLETYSSRTFNRDLIDIEEIFGISITFNRSKGVYETNSDSLDQSKQNFLYAYENMELIRQSDENQRYIVLEDRQLTGVENSSVILDALKQNLALQFNYKSFTVANFSKRLVHPLGLKQYKNRWYLMAVEVEDKEETIKSFGMDRLSNLALAKLKSVVHKDYDLRKEFQHIYGIQRVKGQQPQDIYLKLNSLAAKYLETLPLHKSQRVLERSEQGVTFSFHVAINTDLIKEISILAKDIIEIKPQSLKEKVIEELTQGLIHLKRNL
ncbi:MAG: WYL domain-containing protein [Flavobacterium sp.]|nr:WYL domain-containing protein [Candidatus Neoflavobacterium equi]